MDRPHRRGEGGSRLVGLGQMGTAMAGNLAAAAPGHRLWSSCGRDGNGGAGLKPINIADLFDCGFVISMLPDNAAVREIVFGRPGQGLAAG